MTIFTVGHSNVPLERFVSLLELHDVKVVADVRSNPFSKYCRHFDIDNVREALKSLGFLYVFLGRELGGKPKDERLYDESGNVVYARIAATTMFQQGIERLISGMSTYKIALMCGEEDPTHCHRRRLIGGELQSRGISVAHIRRDGSLHYDADLTELENKKPGVAGSIEQLSLFNALT